YAHVTARLRRDIADQLLVLLDRQMRLEMRLDRSENRQALRTLTHLARLEVVVRGGVEPPTFRFSGGCTGPGESTIGHLSSQDGADLRAGIQDCSHVSRSVVSSQLARSHSSMSGGCWRHLGDGRPGQPGYAASTSPRGRGAGDDRAGKRAGG